MQQTAGIRNNKEEVGDKLSGVDKATNKEVSCGDHEQKEKDMT